MDNFLINKVVNFQRKWKRTRDSKPPCHLSEEGKNSTLYIKIVIKIDYQSLYDDG